jgi:integrase
LSQFSPIYAKFLVTILVLGLKIIMDWQKKISEVNSKLANQPGGTRVKLYIKNSKLWARGTLPCKPWLVFREPYQQFLCLGNRSKLTEEGLKYALQQVRIINAQLENNSFKWEEWVKSPTSQDSNDSILTIWQKYLEFKHSEFSLNTRINLGQITRYLETLSKDSTPKNIKDDLVKTKSIAATYEYLKLLNRAYDWAVKEKLVTENEFAELFKNASIPKRDNQINSFTREERDEILKRFSEVKYKKYLFIVQMLFFTGARPEELQALKWKNVTEKCILFDCSTNIDNSIKDCLKTQKFRKFPINKQLREILDANQPGGVDSECFVFAAKSRNNTPMRFSNFGFRVWNPVVKQLERERKILNYHCLYTCRHTFITLCLESGVNAKDVAAWVGNSAKMIYERYASANINLNVPEL